MTRQPRPFDPDRAEEARALAPWAQGPAAELITGAGGCSPYLLSLIAKEADWLERAFDNPEAARDETLAEAASLPLDQLKSGLRRAKRRIALLAGLADLGGVWPLEEVTGSLTRLADIACHRTLTELLRPELARGRIPGKTEADAEAGAGYAVLAMGKMGAFELNYSSDIDLICLFDDTQFSLEDVAEVRSAFVKITRKLCAILGDNTGEGYVFRTDLRLRPDAAVTPVCLSMSAAESYYEGVGRTWERAAYIKARACAGDISAGERFLETLTPFVWRRHLDFAAIQDAHDMRLRIRDHKGLHGPLRLPRHDMKLGRGGIREIEFFTQTRQIIAGGRDPSLRVRGTVEGLARLAEAGWLPAETAATLTRHYRLHREVEHRLQMIADAQTHALPTNDEGFDRLAAFMGQDRATFEADLTARLEEVHDLIEGFFTPDEAQGDEGDEQEFGAEITARWPDYPALRSARAGELFRRLRPEILGAMQEAARPEEALVNFDRFLSGLPAGVQLFSLFDANPQLTRLIVDIASTAPALAQYLSRNAGVFDAVIGGDFFAPWPGVGVLTEQLAAQLAATEDYEARLDATRRWAKEWHFRVGVHHLRGLISATDAGAQYADLAEAAVAGLWPHVVDDFSAKHGAPPGRGAVVLAMGSLGAQRLNAASDLDLIVIYDGQGVEASEGRRPLATRSYFSRLTQALVTAMTAPTAEGRLYEVDMRLRPSGRQGPVATSWDAFRTYQRDEAWTWEHLALTRARPIAGDASFRDEAEAFRQSLLAEKSTGAGIVIEVADMRRRIAEAKPPQGDWDAKIGPGRLQDAELAAQTLALLSGSEARQPLAQVEAGAAAGLVSADQAHALRRSLTLFWQLQATARLLTGGMLVPDELGEGGRRMVLRETGQDDMETLGRAMKETASRADDVIASLLKGTT
ncbi:glutamine-synthetase adenylyltransferase [Ponticoccus sp. SC2-23]|nr:glutamine-synthetase adenylyltransferase [Ponticoccus sp. SC6-9]MBM1223781.1 glutamine-synthetase adenylyltransferase [Ponticoccus sp. SC6-15]MBM1228961.1 glutamine-synthetase adenylyltransferase [Ponticoccus sp. SC6-38]MBM1232747.1 glutamine-synthetase adenylyltransferase [Ponticoccus sp. SC6-45]MBM1237303.1 glutamine-synthetase adenylyltransferase [Ponticoccus sp. SC6-49]MBM1241758.1 glutamine-synthetase adenylyltransferase [Ponticoccus sp. SC2-64]MBM1246271.1 glutamine-synthetase adenyl